MDHTVQIDSVIEQVVLDIKEEMESRANRLKYMKLRTFLSLLGYRNRKREVLDLVDDYLDEHGIVVYAYGEELEDWFDISHNETITFRFSILSELPVSISTGAESDSGLVPA